MPPCIQPTITIIIHGHRADHRFSSTSTIASNNESVQRSTRDTLLVGSRLQAIEKVSREQHLKIRDCLLHVVELISLLSFAHRIPLCSPDSVAPTSKAGTGLLISETPEPLAIRMQKTARTPEAMNEKMVRFAPELASRYAKYPMHYDRWYEVGEKSPEGIPCFIPSSTNVGLKMDFVFGAGPKGWGYYHLLCRASYASLYARLTHECPISCCSFGQTARRELADFQDVKQLMFSRSRSHKPDDVYSHTSIVAHTKPTAHDSMSFGKSSVCKNECASTENGTYASAAS